MSDLKHPAHIFEHKVCLALLDIFWANATSRAFAAHSRSEFWREGGSLPGAVHHCEILRQQH
jgi:hypothetical protein